MRTDAGLTMSWADVLTPHQGEVSKGSLPRAARREGVNTDADAPQRKEKLHAVIRVASGKFPRNVRFHVFGYLVPPSARAYFPASSEFASLMFSMTTFCRGLS